MGLKAKAGKGKVCGVYFGPDLKKPSVIGFTDISEKVHNIEKPAFFGLHPRNFGKARPPDTRKPVLQRFAPFLQLGQIA